MPDPRLRARSPSLPRVSGTARSLPSVCPRLSGQLDQLPPPVCRGFVDTLKLVDGGVTLLALRTFSTRSEKSRCQGC